jgi:hypothetical protein
MSTPEVKKNQTCQAPLSDFASGEESGKKIANDGRVGRLAQPPRAHLPAE